MKPRRFTYPLLAAATAALLVLAAAACAPRTEEPEPRTEPDMNDANTPMTPMTPGSEEPAEPAPATFDPAVYPNTTNLFVDFETTKGNFTAILFDDLVPNIVDNFVTLARDGFYDGLTFHRVVPNFVIQGGDPNGDGTGGPEERVDDEFHPAALHDSAGILSMANSGFNTNGSQFFVTLDATPHLDAYNPDGTLKNCPQQGVSCHAVFGRVVTGLDVVFNVEIGDVMNTVTIRQEEGNPILNRTADGQELATSAAGLDDGKQYYAAFETSRGNFRLRLRPDEAPRSVAHFVELARRGYYNGIVMQTGSYIDGVPSAFHPQDLFRIPLAPGNPQGGQVVLQNDYSAELKHDGPGVASFIQRGPNLSAGLFQITLEASPQFDAYDSNGDMKADCAGGSVEQSCFAVFGKVIEGMDVITGLDADDELVITRVLIQESAS